MMLLAAALHVVALGEFDGISFEKFGDWTGALIFLLRNSPSSTQAISFRSFRVDGALDRRSVRGSI